jgi:hypothetical protein
MKVKEKMDFAYCLGLVCSNFEKYGHRLSANRRCRTMPRRAGGLNSVAGLPMQNAVCASSLTFVQREF